MPLLVDNYFKSKLTIHCKEVYESIKRVSDV